MVVFSELKSIVMVGTCLSDDEKPKKAEIPWLGDNSLLVATDNGRFFRYNEDGDYWYIDIDTPISSDEFR